jgi:hypothetical protein
MRAECEKIRQNANKREEWASAVKEAKVLTRMQNKEVSKYISKHTNLST